MPTYLVISVDPECEHCAGTGTNGHDEPCSCRKEAPLADALSTMLGVYDEPDFFTFIRRHIKPN